MDFATMNTADLIARRTAIGTECEAEGADVAALLTEAKAINAELDKRAKAEATRAAVRAAVAGDAGVVLTSRSFEQHKTEKKTYTPADAQYRSGWLKQKLGMELTPDERSAVDYVMTTTGTTYGEGSVMPTTLVDEIFDLIEEEHSILADITTYRTGTILEVPVRKSIVQGDAAKVNENAENDDEINDWGKYTLVGNDYSKSVELSYAAAKMSLPQFEAWLKSELADRLGAALATGVVNEILTDYDDDHNELETAAAGKIAYADVAKAFSVLKGIKSGVVIYANTATIYKHVVGMVDTTGRPIFMPNAADGAIGTLIGAKVKAEDAVTGDKLLIGAPKNVIGNFVQDIMLEDDRDIKKHVITYSAYARFESKLKNPKSFSTLTVASGE